MSEKTEKGNNEATEDVSETKQRVVPKVHWDDTNLTTSYANVVNATATHEEVTVFFGTNQTWNVKAKDELTINLSERIILNPLAAKRLFLLLGGVLKDYESRYGALDIKGSIKPGE